MKDFFNRIKVTKEEINFYNLSPLMAQFAYYVPFENIDVIREKDYFINKEFLYEKIIRNNRGGLCYELNPLFFYVLEELGFQVQMVQATINSSKNTLQNTHISTVLEHHGEKYLVDVGFGANQSLQPVPFNGEFVSSMSGDYRVRELPDKQQYVYEKFQDNSLVIGYTFSLELISEEEVNRAKDLVTERSESPFNQGLLMTKTTQEGHKTLTDTTFTIVKNGEKTKHEIDEQKCYELSKREYGIDLKNV